MDPKYKSGQSVILLDKLNKPAGNARIISFNASNGQYTIAFKYPNEDKESEFEVPESMLITTRDIVK